MDTTIPLVSSPLPSIITPPTPPPSATSSSSTPPPTSQPDPNPATSPPPPSSSPPSPPPPPPPSLLDTLNTPPPISPPPPLDTLNTPPPSPLDIINTPPPSPLDTINTPPPSPLDTLNTPPPSPLDTINTPPPPPSPETPNTPPPALPLPSPPATSPPSPPPPEIPLSPPEPRAEPPKKSRSPKNSPSLVPPPSHGFRTPPPHATSPSSSLSFSPPPLTTSSVTAVSSSNVANNGSGMKTGSAAGIGIGVGFVALVLVVLAVLFKRKKRRNVDGLYANYVLPSLASSQKSDSSFLKPQNSAYLSVPPSRTNSMYSPNSGNLGNSRSCFTYEELTEATKGFSKQNILGEGGFGCVYKGVLVDGREVAVKQLKAGGGQGEREFRAEVEIISRVHHRHLVSLVGYCISEHQRLLVYDFVSNDTLDYHLHSEGRPVMGWATRVRVAAGAARGLAYLHEDCHPRIIHRDIKSSNILLDTNFEAQVADFGLAKLAMDTNTHVSTRVMGTFGYLAPEYATSGKVTEKSDVYSFGVVLLELITGRKPVDTSQPYGDESLVEWARPLLTEALERDDFEELIDSRLGKSYDASEVFRMIEAAASCVRHSALKRPRMSQVVRALDSLDEISGLSNGAKPGESVILDSREQSAQIRMFQKTALGSQEYSSDYFLSVSK